MTNSNLIKQSWSDYFTDNLYHFKEQCPFCGHTLVAFKDEDGNPRSSGVCPECLYQANNNSTSRDEIKNLTEQSHKNDSISFCRNTSYFSSPSIFNHKFGNFNVTTSKRAQASRQALALAHKIANGEIVHATLKGNTGTGKTHLAVSILWEVMQASNYRLKVCFVDIHELLTRKKNAISNDKATAANINRTIDHIKKSDLVILDDLGAENAQGSNGGVATSYNTDVITDIINAREDRSLIITTNLTGAEIKETYGSRILSRIISHSENNNILFDGIKDYRISKEV